jgi:hypothetical protein
MDDTVILNWYIAGKVLLMATNWMDINQMFRACYYSFLPRYEHLDLDDIEANINLHVIGHSTDNTCTYVLTASHYSITVREFSRYGSKPLRKTRV